MGGLVRALAGSGEAVTVLADRVRSGGEWAPPAGVTLRRFGGPKPLRRLAKGWAARRVIAAGGVAWVACDSWKSAALLPRGGPPALILAHGAEFPDRPDPARVMRIRDALSRGRAVAANSAFTAGLVRGCLPEGVRLGVVHPPIDPLPEATGGSEGPMLLTLARLEPRKGIDQVLRALPGLAAAHPALTYVVAGAGPDRARLEALAGALGVAARVRFAGRVTDAERVALLAAASAFAMPTRREGASVEGFGIVYREAAWFGVPSLAGREGGGGEAVRDGETGLVCDGADAGAVAAALGQLLGDAGLRARLGAAAAARVRAEGLWAQALPRYRALVEG